MNYDYAIYGGGPTGLFLAYLLGAKYNIILIEKENELGGCWKHEWVEGKYYSEHAPRVFMDDNGFIFDIFREIGMNKEKDFVNTYGSKLETNYKIIKFFFNKLTLRDKLIFFMALFSNLNNLTFKEWMDINKISKKGKNALRILSIVVANTPEKILASEIFEMTNFPLQFLQHKNPQKWIDLMKHALKQKKVTIIKGELQQIHTEFGLLKNYQKIYAKKHLLTLPPYNLIKTIKNSPENIQNNWIPKDKLDKWLNSSHYRSVGFQFHFKEKISTPKEWCWSCSNKYTIIVLPISDFITTFSKDPNIKAVWSCTIVDHTTVKDLTKEQIIDEVKNILNVNPDKVTFYNGLYRVNGQWLSKDTAFSLGKEGVFPRYGKLNNWITVGPHNRKGITVINKTAEIAKEFLEENNIALSKKLSQHNINMLTIERRIGILFLLSVFLVSLFDKITDFKDLLNKTQNLPFPLLAALFAIGSQLSGVTVITLAEFKIINSTYAKYGIYSMVLFTLLATYFFHNIFTNPSQKFHFLKNLSIVGGLIVLSSYY